LLYACSAGKTNQLFMLIFMQKIPENNSPPMRKSNYLPNFCNTDVLLRVVLVIELVAIVFALVSYDSDSLYVHVALLSVLMQWIGLTSAAVFCQLSRWGVMHNIVPTTLMAFGVVLSTTLAVTLLSVTIADMMRFSLNNTLGDTSATFEIIRNLSVAAILIGLALRYFYFQYESRVVLEAQAQARLQVLQARIKPHFLFNSMNTIASLTHDEPDLAEQAIENLADLFRASLAAEDSVSLQQELELTRSYIQIEALRLGDRLTVNWTLSDDNIPLWLPALTLQPLVENAIYHGVEPLSAGGVVDITIKLVEDTVHIVISNPLREDRTEQHRKGNQMAVDNIRERLQITYAGAATMQQLEEDSRFTVTLLLPMLTNKLARTV
jgi:two-component system sensor histidine kinase AlgZ